MFIYKISAFVHVVYICIISACIRIYHPVGAVIHLLYISIIVVYAPNKPPVVGILLFVLFIVFLYAVPFQIEWQ